MSGPASPIEKGGIACFWSSGLVVKHKYLVLFIRVYVEQPKVLDAARLTRLNKVTTCSLLMSS